jgi:phospholipid-binding lipoprotein MlaA
MTFTALARALPRVVAALVLAVVAGCATPGVDHQDRHTAGPKDPYESVNRKVFAFNDTLDTYALKPVAKAYNAVLPSPVRTGVHNFFGNFSDAWSAVNQLLQGKPADAGSMTLRVLTNSTIGIAGLFDPATSLGLERKSEDLGQTLGVWGLEPGPYLVLPLLGSSDIRDALALPADTYVTPALLVPKFWQGVAVDAVGVIDTRAGLLGASQMLDELAFDRYTFMRDAYITRRRSLVYDGNPPELPDEDDADDSKSAPAPAGAASGAKTSSAAAGTLVAATPATPPSQPVPTPPPQPVPGGVAPAPIPASAPTLPVPRVGPAPTPPPPASGAHA